MPLEETGVALGVSGQDAFNSALSGATKSLGAFNQALQKSGSSGVTLGTDKINKGLSETSKKAQETGDIFGAVFSGSFWAGVALKAVGAIGNITSSIVSFGKEAAEAGGRVNEIHMATDAMGTRAGYSSGEIDKMVMSVRNMGIESGVANTTLVQFIRNNMNIADAGKLARVAQDAAVVGYTNSSDALDRLIWGITTQQTEVLRTIGIQVDMNQAMKKYADENKTTVAALDSTQRAQAILNAVLAEGTKLTGVYESAMGSWVKQMGSFTGRILPDLKAALGGPLEEGLFTLVKGLNTVTLAFTALVSPADQVTAEMKKAADQFGLTTSSLYPLIQTIGEGFKGVATGMIEAIPDLIDAAQAIGEALGITFETNSKNAFQWGRDLVINLAAGIVDAISYVVMAITYVATGIAGLLESHSPPKALPQLTAWGAGAMMAYLHGFTLADFSVLESIQSPIQSALSTLAGLKIIDKDQVGSLFTKWSAAATAAISKGKGMSKGFMSSVLGVTGSVYGKEITELIQKQLALATALKAVQAAEEAINEAREKQSAATSKINELTDEYNRMLREGASQEQLKAKREEIAAQMKLRQEAYETQKQQSKSLAEAKKKAEPLQKEVDLQAKIVQQLTEIARANTQQEKAKGVTAKGGAGGNAVLKIPDKRYPEEPPYANTKKTGTEAIGEFLGAKPQGPQPPSALDTAVLNLKKNLQGMQDAIEKMGQGIQPILEDMAKNLQGINDNFNEFKDTIKAIEKSPFFQKLQELGEKIFPDMSSNLNKVVAAILILFTMFPLVTTFFQLTFGRKIGEFLVSVWPQIGTFFSGLWTTVSTFFVGLWNSIVMVFNKIVQFFVGLWEKIKEGFANAKAGFLQGWQDIGTAIGTKVAEVKTAIATKWEEIKLAVSTKWSEIKNAIVTKWDEIKTSVSEKAAALATEISNKWEEMKTAVSTKWEEIKETIKGKWDEFKDEVTKKIDEIISTLTGYADSFYQIGVDWIQGIIDGLKSLWNDLMSLVGQMTGGVIGTVQTESDSHSPSRKTFAIGADISRGLQLGLQSGIAGISKAGISMAQASISPVASAPVIQQRNITYSRRGGDVNMNNVNVNNGMDLAGLKQYILQTVREGI